MKPRGPRQVGAEGVPLFAVIQLLSTYNSMD